MAKTLLCVMVLLTSGLANAKSSGKPMKIVRIEYDVPTPGKRDPRRDIPHYSESRKALAADARHRNRMKKIIDLEIPD